VTLGTANGLSLSTQALSLGLASTSATGALSSTDWNTFNLKQAALTLTTTGTSGAATLVGATLNIPNYNSMVYPSAGIALSTGTAWGTSITDNSANWNTAYTNRITSATAPLSIISNVIAMSEATGSVDGYLSRFDWTTFNNKQATITLTTTGTSGAATFTSNTLNIPQYQGVLTNPVTGTGTTNYLPKFTGASAIGNSLVYDDGTYVGINTITPSSWATKLVIYNNQLTVTGGGYDGTFADSIFFGGNSEGTNYRNKISNSLSATAANQKMKFSVASGATTWVDALTLTGTGAATFSSSVQGASFYVPSTVFTPSVPAYQTLVKYGQTNTFAEIQGGNLNLDNFSTYLRFIVNGTASNTPLVALTLANTGAATFSSSVTAASGLFTGTGDVPLSINSTINSPYLSFQKNSVDKWFLVLERDTPVWGMAINDFGIYNNNISTLVFKLANATGAATFSSSVTAVNTIVSSATVGGSVKFNYGANAASRSYIIVSDAYNYGDLGFQQSTTQTGSTYSNKMILAANGDLTIGSVPSTGVGSIYAGAFFEGSDMRLKTLIKDNYQTKGIASITPKLYTKNGKVELGYYAQDLVGVLDSAVSKGEDEMLSLSYREVLVAKVYALEQEIKELKAKMN
jgi:hypothetical protein